MSKSKSNIGIEKVKIENYLCVQISDGGREDKETKIRLVELNHIFK